MALNYTQALVPQTLPAGDFLAYTVLPLTISQIRAATIHNKTASPIVLKISIVPSGGTLGAQHQVAQKSIPANSSYMCPELINHTLKTGDKLYLNGEGLNGVISVVEQT